MASTYSPSLRLELMATGDQSGTWGDTTNTNLGTLLEQAITGYLTTAQGDVANKTLTSLNGATDEARNMVVNMTGALTAARNVVVPTAKKIYLFRNSTTGGFALTIKTAAGTGVAVAAGQSRWVYCDGTNVIDGLTGFYTVGGTDVAIADGGTGQSTPNLPDGTWRFASTTDPTKLLAFDVSGGPTAVTRTLTAPYGSGTMGLVSDIRGQIFGLTISNNVADATNDIDVSPGSAVDNTGTVSMVLASGLTKQLDAVWAVGNNAGMRASGAAIANTTYHIFLIRRTDTFVVDIAADTSMTGANIAANTNVAYTQIRRIGSIVRGGGAIKAFVQDGDYFGWSTIAPDVQATNPGAAAAIRTLTVPSGGRFRAKISVGVNIASTSTDNISAILISDLAVPDATPIITSAFTQLAFQTVPGGQFQDGSVMEVFTNTSSQVRSRLQSSAVGTTLYMQTIGYYDTRGR